MFARRPSPLVMAMALLLGSWQRGASVHAASWTRGVAVGPAARADRRTASRSAGTGRPGAESKADPREEGKIGSSGKVGVGKVGVGKVGKVGSIGRKPASRTAAKPVASRPARAPSVVPNLAGKVVLFGFRNDDGAEVSSQVVRLLGAHGLQVMTGVQRVDTAEQFRDMATHLDLVAYVDGEVRGTDARTRVTVRLRNGYSGRNISQATFSESRANLPRELGDKLWTKVGPPMARACKDAEKPRKKGRTLQINAGTPIETVPNPPKKQDGT